MNLGKFFKEIKRRNVIRETIAYIVIAWVILQVAAIILPIFSIPDWILKTITIILILGIPFVITMSWIYDITKKGLRPIRELNEDLEKPIGNKKLNIVITSSVIIALTLFVFVGKTVKELNDAPPYSIAILPFEYSGPDDNTKWLADAIRSSIWQRMIKFSGLKPISNRSSDIAKESKFTNSEIASKLDVRYLLEATINTQNDLAIINFRLWDSNEDLLQLKEYKETTDNFFRLQKNAARWVVEGINFEIGKKENNILNSSETDNIDAYLLNIKGERLILDRKPWEAIQVLRDAIKLDSTYASAYANLAWAYMYHSQISDNYYTRDNFRLYDSLAKKTLHRAFVLDSNNSRALITKANLIKFNDINRTTELSKKALDNAPNDPFVYLNYESNRSPEEILSMIKRAYELEPTEWQHARYYVRSLAMNGRMSEALEILNEANPFFNWDNLGDMEEFKAGLSIYEYGNYQPLIDFYRAMIEKDSLNPEWQFRLADCYDTAFNNDSLYLVHTRKAYLLEAKKNKKVNNFMPHYISALIENFMFDDAKKLFSTDDFKNQSIKTKHEVYKKYFTHRGDYDELKRLIDTSAFSKDSINYILYKVQAGLIKSPEEIDNKYYECLTNLEKAEIFAILGNRDSLYSYINHVRFKPIVNSRHVFDPYREDPEFKAFQKMWCFE